MSNMISAATPTTHEKFNLRCCTKRVWLVRGKRRNAVPSSSSHRRMAFVDANFVHIRKVVEYSVPDPARSTGKHTVGVTVAKKGYEPRGRFLQTNCVLYRCKARQAARASEDILLQILMFFADISGGKI